MIKGITNIKCFDNEIWIKIFGEKKPIVQPYRKTFFCKKDSFKPISLSFEIKPSDKKYFFTKAQVDQITIVNPASNRIFDRAPREFLYLYDLFPEYQYLLYNECKFSPEVKIIDLDIETDDSIDSENVPKPIFMVGAIHNGEYIYFDHDECGGEKRMLSKFFEWFTEEAFADVVFGWNVIDFDKAYLLNRAKEIGVSYDYKRFQLSEFINGWDVFEKKFGWGLLKETGGKSLHSVSMHFLKRGKIDMGTTFGKMYRHDRHKAIKYNENDLWLTYELNKEVHGVKFLSAIQSVSGVPLRDTFHESRVIDFMILKRYNNFVFPSKEEDPETIAEYEGGYVLNPPKGLFKNVAIFDFAAMYPSIILTFNISPDSKVSSGGDYHIDDIHFKADPPGLFKETIKYLYDERLKLKAQLKMIKDDKSFEYKNADSLQTAFKTILNSFYGVCAYRKFRFHDLQLAMAITSMGRKLIKVLKDGIEELGLGKVQYGDTDSIFLQFNTDPEKILTAINNFVIPNYISKFGVKENYVRVEIGKIFEWIIFFGKKKKYIGKLHNIEKLYIKGFLTERYDTPDVIRKYILQIVIDLATGKTIELAPYLEKLKSNILQELIILKRLNKSVEDYKSDPQHLQALEFSRKYFSGLDELVYVSNIVRMLYVKSKTYPSVNVLAVDDDVKQLPYDFEIDYDRYFVFYLLNSMMDIYEIFGYDKVVGAKQYLERIISIDEKVVNKKNLIVSTDEMYEFMIKKSWLILNKKKKENDKKSETVEQLEEVESTPIIGYNHKKLKITGDYFGRGRD